MQPSVETDIRLIRYSQSNQSHLDPKAGEEANLVVPRLSSSPVVNNNTTVPVNTVTDDSEQKDSHDVRDDKIEKSCETAHDKASSGKSSFTEDRLHINKQAEEESKVTIISNLTAKDKSITASTNNSKFHSTTEREDEKVIIILYFTSSLML